MTEARADGRLPLTILGGFLGAGKSTWLRHQLFTGHFGRVHVLVNEAAETPVDDLLLGRATGLQVLAGGCACCAGRPALIAALHDLCDALAGARAGTLDQIVLETSGLADPAAIAGAIQSDPILQRRLVLTRTIVLVDAQSGAEQLQGEPLARAQVQAADDIVITKSDAVGPAALSRLSATLRALAPGAGQDFADFGVAVTRAPDPAALPLDLPELAPDRPAIAAHRLDASGAGGWWALSAWLSALLHARGDSIVRVKGVIHTPAGRLLLQSVRRHVQPPEILPDADADASRASTPDFLVLIGSGIDEARLDRSWNRFVLGRDEPA